MVLNSARSRRGLGKTRCCGERKGYAMSDTYKDHRHPPGWENEHDPRCQACAQSELASSDGSGIMVTAEAYRELEAENRDLMRIVRKLQIKLDAATVGQPHECEEQVIAAIRERRERGRRKYATTMERDDLTPAQWAQHAQEEALDFAIYLERLKRLFQNAELHVAADWRRMTHDNTGSDSRRFAAANGSG